MLSWWCVSKWSGMHYNVHTYRHTHSWNDAHLIVNIYSIAWTFILTLLCILPFQWLFSVLFWSLWMMFSCVWPIDLVCGLHWSKSYCLLFNKHYVLKTLELTVVCSNAHFAEDVFLLVRRKKEMKTRIKRATNTLKCLEFFSPSSFNSFVTKIVTLVLKTLVSCLFYVYAKICPSLLLDR